jgi:hypothetical protein
MPVNSWARMLNLSKVQTREILMKLAHPDEMNDILFTGFLIFDNVTDPEIFKNLLDKYRSVFDGPFCEFNTKHPLLLVLQFLEIGDHEIQMDVGDLLHEVYSKVAHELIANRIGVTKSSIDFISRFMQLASAFTYLSGSSRVPLLSDIIARIKLVVIALFDFVMTYQSSFGCWRLEVMTAAHLARTVVDREFLIAKFNRLVLQSGYGRRIGFYQMLMDMTEQIIETSLVNAELVKMMTQMKIEALGLMTLFMPASKTMHKLVKASLEYRNVKEKPYCRHLLVLLWALGSGHDTPYKDSCKLLMDYILQNMPPCSNLTVFKRLNVLHYAPISVRLIVSRQDLSSDVGMTIVDKTLQLDYLKKVKLFKTDKKSRSTLASNGYLDVQKARTQILSRTALILQEYFVYCGHRNGIPVYIQSLGCHQDISSLLQ